ncbi:MAG: 1-deoxy-D-xylulose-5-phosphate reductoisomerase [Chloroflexi bacterium]|nr:1-deoxy-D-xylulose-5-phosphate reductoisomerase [Chloroflexota bacterium]
MTKRLAILGCTGSIGQQTLDVVRAHPEAFSVTALAAGSNASLLSRQIQEFGPKLVWLGDQQVHLEATRPFQRQVGLQGLLELVADPDVDLVVIATGGKAGLLPTLAAIRAEKRIALANKESLIMAGEIVMAEAQKHGVQIQPIDSEHSAIWQCLHGESVERVRRILLTASGGAFRDYPPERLAQVTPEEALRHPTWLMGKKVTVDSATLMNKGLEVIEAHWLFGVGYDLIQVLIHRESIIHSMVEFVDGSIKAQLSLPDMRFPIQYALTYPNRLPNTLTRLDLVKLGKMTFEEPDLTRYPCLRLALAAARQGGTYPTVMCAADEEAVNLFLAGRIRFTAIAQLVQQVLEAHQGLAHPDLDAIMAADQWARERCLALAR